MISFERMMLKLENDAEALAVAASTRIYGNGKPEEAERRGDG